jgi:sulfopyruvate decarboxylase TPP-binding subunit
MDLKHLYNHLISEGYNFFTGVPDSGLKDFQNSVIHGDYENVIATHESQAVAIAFGAELAGKKSCVYLQNSGVGNIINPLTSLCLPANVCPLLIIGHRHTLPQHEIMGRTDRKILDTIGYTNFIIINGDNNVK